MKKKNIIVIVALIFGLVGAALVAASILSTKHIIPLSTDDVPPPVIQETVRPVAVPLDTEKKTEKYYSLDLEYPRSGALAEMTTYVDKVKSDFMDIVPKTDEQAAYEGLSAGRAYVLKMNTTVYTSSSTITYKLETYQFTGGAHGGTFVSTFTYDANGNFISLSDILRSSDSIFALSSGARAFFYAKLGTQSSREIIDVGTEPTEENFGVWYVTDTAVRFVFQQYQIGPYVLGIQEYPLSRNEASAILKI